MNKRTYSSKLRAERAAETRESIIEAAIRLHGQGITAYSAVAEEAGVSLPTVQKHFPTKEDLFTACTSHYIQRAPLPSLEEIAATADPVARVRKTVEQFYTIYESTAGYLWLSYRLAEESPVIAQTLGMVDQMVQAAAGLILREWEAEHPDEAGEVSGFVRGMLSPLTYRALRLSGGLSPEQAIERMTDLLASLMGSAGGP